MAETDRSRLARVEEIFAAAKELPAEQRPAFLAQKCAGDAALLEELRQLLELDAGASPLLDQPADPWLGRTLERWRIVRRLGAGGMGVVYLAERVDGAFRQRAALKLLKHGLDSPGLVERFRQERQILAALSHPGIARLIDGGASAEGIPWLVMEYVEGTRLDQWCDERQLTLARRLELFRSICAAVQYAHQHLVVHRDIKPSNVIVSLEGVPILLDFGISKVIDATSGDAPTRSIERRLTPEYAAPEVIRGGGVGTGSDIFSLGVLLHELLTGHRPWRLSEASVTELERAICESRPPPPSASAISSAAAESRGLSQKGLARALRGDLDAIVAAALEPDPALRYASVQALSDDVARALAHEPVQARAGGPAYRFGRFVRRHRLLSAAAGISLLALAAGGYGLASGAREARRHADATARANSLLSDMLRSIDPFSGKSFSRSLLSELEAADKRLDAGLLADDPAAELELRSMLAWTYHSFGHDEESSAQYAAALELARRVAPRDELRLAGLLRGRGAAERGRLRFDESVRLLEEAVTHARAAVAAAPGARPARVEFVASLHELGLALPSLGKHAEAEAALREALEVSVALDGGADEAAAGLRNALAMELLARGDAKAAEPLARAAFELRKRLYPGPDVRMAWSDDGLVRILLALDRPAEALPFAEQGIAIRRELLDPHSPALAWSHMQRGRALEALGRHAEAAGAFESALAIRRAITPPDPALLAATLFACGLAKADAGDLPAARPLLEEALRLAPGNDGSEAQKRARELLQR